MLKIFVPIFICNALEIGDLAVRKHIIVNETYPSKHCMTDLVHVEISYTTAKPGNSHSIFITDQTPGLPNEEF